MVKGHADPDLDQAITLMEIRIELFTLMWILILIRILFFIKVMGIRNQNSLWTLQGSILSVYGPPRHYFAFKAPGF